MDTWKRYGEGEWFVASARSSLDEGAVGLAATDWAALESAYGRSDQIPFWLRALAGTEPPVLRAAIAAILGEIEHQGSVYASTKPAVRALVQLLEDGLVTHEGARNRLRASLNWKGLFKLVPSSSREAISTKHRPLDGLVGFPPDDFTTYVHGLREGPYAGRDVAGGREACAFAKGKRSGLFRRWSATGQLLEQGELDADRRTGAWSEWHPSGTKKLEGAYARGKLSGSCIHYDEAGLVLAQGSYKDDRRHGEWLDGEGHVTHWKSGIQR